VHLEIKSGKLAQVQAQSRKRKKINSLGLSLGNIGITDNKNICTNKKTIL
jgi:hypothetical protein